MLMLVGRESEYTKEELQALVVSTNTNGEVTEFPKVTEGQHVACAFNQCAGLEGWAKMYICQTLEDMNKLVHSYQSGNAVNIKWYAIPDSHFVKINTMDELKQSNRTQLLSTIFKPKPGSSTSSQAAALNQENQNRCSL